MPVLVVLFTKLPNACTETSFFSAFSDCENAGSAAEAMPTIHVTINLFPNILLLPCSTEHRLCFHQCSLCAMHAGFQSGEINELWQMRSSYSKVMLERCAFARH